MINEASEVERLTRELNSLNLRAQQISERLEELGSREEERNTTQHIPLRIGDTVRVLTNYRNRRGTIGIITRLTRSSVWIRPSFQVHTIPRTIQLRISSVARVTTGEVTPTELGQSTQDVVQPEQ